MAEKTDDFLMKLSDLLGQDREALLKKVEGLGVDQMIELLDAVRQNDAGKVRDVIGQTEDLGGEDELPSADDGLPGEDNAPEDEEAGNSAADYTANIGDDVRVGDKEGTIKIAHGPNDTVGVMIDGELKMVKAKDVRPLNEQVLGFTPMFDLQRMQQLAGIAPQEETEEATVEMAPIMGEQPVTPSQVRYITKADLMQIAADAALPFGSIMAVMNDIERSLPDLKVRDAKEVRARLTQLLTKLNESRSR